MVTTPTKRPKQRLWSLVEALGCLVLAFEVLGLGFRFPFSATGLFSFGLDGEFGVSVGGSFEIPNAIRSEQTTAPVQTALHGAHCQ
jgi:hypothetical protein